MQQTSGSVVYRENNKNNPFFSFTDAPRSVKDVLDDFHGDGPLSKYNPDEVNTFLIIFCILGSNMCKFQFFGLII